MKFLTHWTKISCVDDAGKEIGKVTFPDRGNGCFEIKHTTEYKLSSTPSCIKPNPAESLICQKQPAAFD